MIISVALGIVLGFLILANLDSLFIIALWLLGAIIVIALGLGAIYYCNQIIDSLSSGEQIALTIAVLVLVGVFQIAYKSVHKEAKK